MRTTLHHSLALLSAIVGCHVDAPCESSLPVGAHLEVRVLEVTIAAAGAECDKVALLAQDQFRIKTGKPLEGGPNNDCLSPSAEGPPSLAGSLSMRKSRFRIVALAAQFRSARGGARLAKNCTKSNAEAALVHESTSPWTRPPSCRLSAGVKRRRALREPEWCARVARILAD